MLMFSVLTYQTVLYFLEVALLPCQLWFMAFSFIFCGKIFKSISQSLQLIVLDKLSVAVVQYC